MRITRTQAQANRDKVLDTAATLFRERGFDGVAVGDLMKTAGFTHGGFYNHFDSKEVLAAEALDRAFRIMDEQRAKAETLDDLMAGYLSPASRQAPGRACPAAALAGDTSRQPDAVKAVFGEGLERMIQSVSDRLPPGPDNRAKSIDLLLRSVGALALSRAVTDQSPLAQELLDVALAACRREIGS